MKHLPKVGASPLALTGARAPFLKMASKGAGGLSMVELFPHTLLHQLNSIGANSAKRISIVCL